MLKTKKKFLLIALLSAVAMLCCGMALLFAPTSASVTTNTNMTVKADDANTWVSEPIELTAGAQLKVCFNGGWDLNYGANGVKGGDNYVVSEAGTYVVTITLNYDDLDSGCTFTVTKQ